MRIMALAAAVAALAACGQQTGPVADVAETAPAETPAPAETASADAHADHGGMDAEMAAADTADDANTAETTDGFTFHTYPNKIEAVHLPSAAGGTWTPVTTDTALVSVGAGSEETMPDGSVHFVVPVTTLASGNAVVTFERREGDDSAAAPVETRSINFMIH